MENKNEGIDYITLSGSLVGWEVVVMVDDDGHLNLYLKHEDETNIIEIETGQGNGKDGEQMAVRFTTEGIEKTYQTQID